jgi:preprotein translocase subunit SecA
MRLFGSDRLATVMEKLGMKEGEVIESRLVSRQIEGAQRRVETHNFDIRKQLLDYDKVLNKQREVVYGLRNQILDGKEVHERVLNMLEEDLEDKTGTWTPASAYPETWDIGSFSAYLQRTFGIVWSPKAEEVPRLDVQTLKDDLLKDVHERYEKRPAEFQGYDFGELEKMVLLQMMDQAWKNHLYDLDHLKKSIGLRAYGQKDPLVEYQRESFGLFEIMLGRVREQTVEYLFRVQAPRRPPPPPRVDIARPDNPDGKPGKGPAKDKGVSSAVAARSIERIGRNDPCPCGSGKKYKRCCGS